MTSSAKRLARLKTLPKDFSWNELIPVMQSFGFSWHTSSGGSSHGSFVNTSTKRKLVGMYKPHGAEKIKRYQLQLVLVFLEALGRAEENEDDN